MTVRVLGIAYTKDQLDWACIDGTSLSDATIRDRDKAGAPAAAAREEQLAWVRNEVLGLIERCRPDKVAIRAAESGGAGSLGVGRVEVQGVVLASVGEAGLICKRVYSATVRSVFGGGKKTATDAAIAGTPGMQSVAKTRRDPVVAAMCGLMK
jgi:hypothetical protein